MRITCKTCGSADVWRISQQSGLIAAIMRYRGRKPLQCRACGWICYKRRQRHHELPQYSNLLNTGR
jgi:hypothetical protein